MNQKTVLVAGRNQKLRNWLGGALSGGFEVREAPDEAAALELLRAQSFCALVVAMETPGELRLLERCKSDRELSGVPVLLVCEQAEARALALGAAEFIVPPCGRELLLHRLSVAVDFAEKEAVPLEHEIDNDRRRLQAVVQSVPGGIATYRVGDEGIETLYYNDALCALLGYTRAEYRETLKRSKLLSVHADDRETLLAQVADCVRHGCDLAGTYRLLRKDGDTVWVRLTAKYMGCDDDGAVFQAVLLDVTAEREAVRLLNYRAEHDLLTGIYNRDAFCLHTADLLRRNPDQKYVLLRCNIDDFKLVNDIFGLEVGDRILRDFANRLRDDLKGVPSTFVRYDADHFVCCLEARHVDKEKMLRQPSREFTDLDGSYSVTVSVGVYEIDDPGAPVEKMCDRALLALQSIRGRYFGRCAYYDESLRAQLLEERQVLSEAEEGLANGAFIYYLQPIYNVFTNAPAGAEALVRWNHPKRGLLGPDLFVPVLERSDFITRLDFCVWEGVCRYLRRRLDAGTAVLPVSVNVSRMNLYNPNLCERIVELADRYGVDHDLLHLEVTESAYMDRPQLIVETIGKLRALGFHIYMDDFGSGYSSLNMLKDLPVDTLKIDRSFISDIGVSDRADSVLSSIVRLARWLNIPVVAEGVETVRQLDYLRGIGCSMAQGFLLARPMPPDDFDARVAESERRALASASPAAREEALPGDNRRVILVADDNVVNRMVLKKQLGGLYRVLEAENGRQTLELLRQEKGRVEALLLDIVMPVMSGYDVLAVMKTEPEIADIPVLVITGNDTQEAEVRALEFGANDFIKKPFEASTIRLRIANAIELRDATMQHRSDRAVLNSIPAGILQYEISDAIRLEYVSEGIDWLSGLSASEYMSRFGRDPMSTVAPQDRERVRDAFLKNGAKRVPLFEVEFRTTGLGDHNGWRVVRLRFAEERGKSAIYYGIATDSSQRHGAAEALAKSRNELSVSYTKLQLAIEHADLNIWEYDIGQRALLLPGDSRGAVPLDTLFAEPKRFHSDDVPALRDAFARLDEGESPVELTCRVGYENTYRWFTVSFTVVCGAQGEPISAVGIARDVTEEVRLRLEYEKENRYRRSQLAGALFVLECDLETGRILNREAFSALGLPKDADITTLHRDTARRIVHPEDWRLFHIAVNRDALAAEIRAGKRDNSFECRMQFPNSIYEGYRWMMVNFSFIINPATGHPHVFMSVRDIHDRKLKELDVQERAQRDSLTGLYNRATYEERVRAALESDGVPHRAAFYIIDIDNFKQVNDSCGHRAGDEVLQTAAKGLQRLFRAEDCVGRLGGDELAVFLADLPNAALAKRKGDEICTAVSAIRVSESGAVSCSVGVAVSPEHATTFSGLYHCADAALYAAKQRGKNQCALFGDDVACKIPRSDSK